MPPQRSRANILGELTAEADEQMLKTAFYESSNYRALLNATDFRFVVGRRGTGKSALFRKVSEALARDQKRFLLITERPAEELVASFNYEIEKLTNEYLPTRKITRLTWKFHILSRAIDTILGHYKVERVGVRDKLKAYRDKHAVVFTHSGIGRSLAALRESLHFNDSQSAQTLPEAIAERFDLANTETLVNEALADLKRQMVLLYDGLDEGWVANRVATGFLGGLAKVASEFRETEGIHCLLFIRDNMFRALAEFDGDYSRNIEGNTLRLHWDENSLLEFVALRIRAAFQLDGGEQSIRMWNRFAHRDLAGIDGFRRCLRQTLYRPRDVIALLNYAYQIAQQASREDLIHTDTDSAAIRISQTRLDDLYKEYDHVFPGLPLFVQSFRAGRTRTTYGQALEALESIVNAGHPGTGARDFALLRTASEAFDALYSVGFLGVQNADRSVQFCHDGSNTSVESLPASTSVVVHPCYWRALDLNDEDGEEVILRVDDEDDPAIAKLSKRDFSQMRVRKLGTIIAELGTIKEGKEDAAKFEKWVFDAVRYLFVRGLDNIGYKPNPALVQQRDIVGTIRDVGGFWKRVARYDVSQLVIEAKNYAEITATDFRQAWGYMAGPYGRCLVMVTRAELDSITEHERALVKEGYDTQNKLVILLPSVLLHRALRKMQNRNEERDDYIDKKLGKRMDVFEREFIAGKTPRVPRR